MGHWYKLDHVWYTVGLYHIVPHIVPCYKEYRTGHWVKLDYVWYTVGLHHMFPRGTNSTGWDTGINHIMCGTQWDCTILSRQDIGIG